MKEDDSATDDFSVSTDRRNLSRRSTATRQWTDNCILRQNFHQEEKNIIGLLYRVIPGKMIDISEGKLLDINKRKMASCEEIIFSVPSSLENGVFKRNYDKIFFLD